LRLQQIVWMAKMVRQLLNVMEGVIHKLERQFPGSVNA
jgi:hypothetical protein